MINKFEAFYLLRLLDFSKNFRLDLGWMRQSKSNSKLISRNVGQRISQIRSFSFYFFRFSKNFWIRWFISVSVVRWQAVRCLVRSKVLVTLAVRVSDTGWLFFFFFFNKYLGDSWWVRVHSVIFNRSKLRKMCLIRTSRSCRLNAIFFFYEKSWKIISRTDSFGLLFIEITMLLNFQWKKIIKKKKLRDQSSISRFTLLCHTSMKILFILRLNEHTVPEKGLHYAWGCFFPIYKFCRWGRCDWISW